MAWPLPEKKRPGGQPSNGFEDARKQMLEEEFEEEIKYRNF
jgi:hypothetical protein